MRQVLARRRSGAEQGPETGPADPATRRPRRRWLAVAAWAGAALVVFACYLRVSQTYSGDSYGAVFTLQAWDMLHGNLLLHGWWLSDVSFYNTELPEYMLVELVLGRSRTWCTRPPRSPSPSRCCWPWHWPGVSSTGRAAAVRMAITAGIMCSPPARAGRLPLPAGPGPPGQLRAGPAGVADPGPRAPALVCACRCRRPAGLDIRRRLIVALTGIVPLALICAARLYARVVTARQPLRAQWFEGSLLAAAAAAAAGVPPCCTCSGRRAASS